MVGDEGNGTSIILGATGAGTLITLTVETDTGFSTMVTKPATIERGILEMAGTSVGVIFGTGTVISSSQQSILAEQLSTK